jgi:HK97 family phage major capsid protein
MEIKEMNFEELEQRRAELAAEIDEADSQRIDRINKELDEIEERKKEIKAEAEKRAAIVEEVISAPNPTPIEEERKENKMTSKEIRSTQEYIDAYVEYCKRNYDLEKVGAEARALLTENATNGTVAVPTYVEERINTAWENDEIMKRVRRTFVPGNLKVGVEVSATGAVIHTEGGDAIDPENLVLNYIELVPQFVKKLVEVSHSALALTGTAFLDYLYDEIEYQIVKKCADTVLANIATSTLTASRTAAGTGVTTADIIRAEGLLGGEANDVVFVTSRANAAAVKAAALSASYGYDPFDGMPVLYGTMPTGVLGFVVDLSGVQANFPEGGEPKFIFDEYTKADENIVRIVGRLMMGAALAASGKAVKIIPGGTNPEA